jgi:putative ABC transport system ATP-binding protein
MMKAKAKPVKDSSQGSSEHGFTHLKDHRNPLADRKHSHKDGDVIMEAKGITKCFGEDMECEVEILKGIDLRIHRGDIVSIMGPSGSGKTTFLDILGCLMRPTQGEVFIDGERVNELSDNELAKIRGQKIGFIFQQYNLIASYTALENVELSMRINGKSKSESREKAKELLTLVGLGHRMTHKPSQLSGGEQQRVAIARALANDPTIILGDEPTGNLDTKTGFMILELLRDLNRKKGYTIVVVTHDPRIGSYTDHTINMLDGKILNNINNRTH